MSEAPLLRWIPLIPLAVVLFHALFVGWLRRSPPYVLVAAASCGAVLASFALSCFAVWNLVALPGSEVTLTDEVYTWFGVGVGEGAFSVDVAFRMDPLASVMCLLITGVGSVIHCYAAGVMRDDAREDRGAQRFFGYLGALTAFSLVVVLADDLIFLLLGWEGVGFATWLLLGFWYSDPHNEGVARRALVIDRIGDAALLLGGFLVFAALAEVGRSGFSFAEIESAFAEISGAVSSEPRPVGGEPWLLVQISGLCFLVAACAKSAQFPLHVWLRGAADSPVSASALIHSATTLAMGVYLLCRLDFLFAALPAVSDLLAWLGALTALLAVAFAAAERELSRVLSHLAVSQFGLIFLAFGAGAPAVSVFHLMTCAFSFSLLFLVAGSVTRVFQGERDMNRMGGLANQAPVLTVLFGIGALTLSGFPALSGFFSRDLVLLAVGNSSLVGRFGLYAIALVVVATTAFCALRCFVLVFLGEPKRREVAPELPRWPSKIETYSLYVLAFFASVIGFFVGLPQFWGDAIDVQRSNSLATFLRSPLAEEGTPGLEYWMVFLALSMAVAGYALAWVLYVRRPELRTNPSRQIRAIQRLLSEELFVTEFYQRSVARPFEWFARRVVSPALDPHVTGGGRIADTLTALRATATQLLRQTQTGLVQVYVFAALVGVLAVVGLLFLGEAPA